MDTILPPSSTQLFPHLRLQSFSINLSTPSFAQLHSSSSCTFKQEELLLFHFRLSLLYFNWHSLAYKKGDVLYVSNPKSHVPPDHVTKTHGPYALAVCKTQSCCPPESAWYKSLPSLQPTSTWRKHRQPFATMPQPHQLQKLPSHMLLVRALRYVQKVR